jgi:hypothetical protein
MEASDIEKKPIHDGSMRKASIVEENIEGTVDGITVNASGHRDQLQRHFSIWSLIGLAVSLI